MTSVLIADDSRLIRQRAREALEPVGYGIREAEDGPEALDAILDERPDALVLNVEMPNTGKFEVLDELAARDIDLPIVVATARDDEKTARQFLDRGAVDFLVKDPLYGIRIANAVQRGILLDREPDVEVTEADPGRVLLLDDSPVIRRAVTDILGEADLPLAVEEAENADQALDLVRGQAFDVLLIDHVLPDTEGADFLASLREEGVQAPAMALTGQRDPDVADRFHEAGASGVWTKEHESPLRLQVTVAQLVRLNRVTNGDPPPPDVLP